MMFIANAAGYDSNGISPGKIITFLLKIESDRFRCLLPTLQACPLGRAESNGPVNSPANAAPRAPGLRQSRRPAAIEPVKANALGGRLFQLRRCEHQPVGSDRAYSRA